MRPRTPCRLARFRRPVSELLFACICTTRCFSITQRIVHKGWVSSRDLIVGEWFSSHEPKTYQCAFRNTTSYSHAAYPHAAFALPPMSVIGLFHGANRTPRWACSHTLPITRVRLHAFVVLLA